MPGSWSDYAEAAILNHLFGGIPWNIVPTWYLGYMVGTPGETTPGAEPNSGNYARVPLANTTANFPVTSNQIKTNANEHTFQRATANHGLVQAVGFWDSPSSGNMVAYCPLAQPVQVEINDAFRLPPGAFTLQFNAGGLSNYAKNAILNQVFGGVPFNIINTLYTGYMTSTPTDAVAGTEPTGNGYLRQAIGNTTNNFPATTTGNKLLVKDVVFGEATASQGTATHLGFWDAAAAGNYLGGFLIEENGAPHPMVITSGMIPYLPANTIEFTLD